MVIIQNRTQTQMSIQTVKLSGEKPLVTLGLHRVLRYDIEIMNYQKEEQGMDEAELVGSLSISHRQQRTHWVYCTPATPVPGRWMQESEAKLSYVESSRLV